MVKKLRKIAESKSDGQMAKSVRESAQQIWLAGLGAFAKAREDGSKVFETLVQEGRNLQAKTREIAGDRLDDVADRVGEVTGRVSRQASESWDRLEQVFEQRVSRALVRLGLPTAEELAELSERVDRLAASVAAHGGAAGDKRGQARKAGTGRSAGGKAAGAKAPAAETSAVKTGATKTGARKAAAARGSAAKAPAAKSPGRRTAASAPRSSGRKAAGSEAPAAAPAASKKPRSASKKAAGPREPGSAVAAAPRARRTKAPKSAD